MSLFTSPQKLAGFFIHRETKLYFEFREIRDEWGISLGFTHEIAVNTLGINGDQGYRCARVLKTVAHVAVDEADG